MKNNTHLLLINNKQNVYASVKSLLVGKNLPLVAVLYYNMIH
jgi:hypothetical protein